ncbi:Hsp20/alpha crystallin family protein [uncultured Maribacter sp.]|uniref:Hsp20/alpha crystallin family protein n=1 Tax=uncultured Maribacter sp. TaxID=431308 RepID=UPI00261658EC|nr:Hsp20/alpha crystallin family protein [uncultured Maribacter sp.]
MNIARRNEVFLPSLLDEIFKPDWFGGIENHAAKIPPVNILESDDFFEIELLIPGRKKEEFVIEIDKNILSVSVSNEEKKEDEKGHSNRKYTKIEFKKLAFKRAFNLPDTIVEERVSASYEDGILKFVLPKKEEALPKEKRQISLR